MLKDNGKYVFLYIYWKSSGFEPATCLFVLRRGCDLSQSMTYKLLLKELSCMRCNSFGQHLAGKIPKRKIPKQHQIKTSINTPFLSIFCFVWVLWVSMKRWVFSCIKSPENCNGASWLSCEANMTRGSNIMMTMGSDFEYEDGWVWGKRYGRLVVERFDF